MAMARLISMRFLAGLVLSALVASSVAQPRDGALAEERLAAEAQACDGDRDCASAARRVHAAQLRDEARAEAIYQGKPTWQKLLGWLAIPAVFWVLWRWAGRKPSSSNSSDKDSIP